MAISLNNVRLADLPSDVARPHYDRRDLSPGIVHFGVGNFHRAHMALYLDDLFNRGFDLDWAIIGAGVTPSTSGMRERLKSQDYLTTVIERDVDRSAARVVGSMIDYIPTEDNERLHVMLCHPMIRIASLTITEGGYFLDASSGRVNADHRDIVHDALNMDAPRTVFGHIAKALRVRRAIGLPPFSVVSCDNVPHNGDVARSAVAAIVDRADPSLAQWINTYAGFPNAMVDRIVPATGEGERALTTDTFGVVDRAPVVCERFRQWVLEDRFSAGRPAFETVGVTFVDDVTGYEQMKLRVLNGSHAAIAYPAALLDIHLVSDAMSDIAIRRYLDKLALDEIVPTVPVIPGVNARTYFEQCAQRFSNPHIGDTIPRLCADGSNRQPKFILPTLLDRLHAGADISGLGLASALWCRSCGGLTDSGKTLTLSDIRWPDLHARACASMHDPDAWLSMTDIYGAAGRNPRFQRVFAQALEWLSKQGTRQTLHAYADGALAAGAPHRA